MNNGGCKIKMSANANNVCNNIGVIPRLNKQATNTKKIMINFESLTQIHICIDLSIPQLLLQLQG